MLVKDFMATNVVKVDAESSIVDASDLLKENKIRRLCVVKGDRLVGIVTDSDIKAAGPSAATTLSIYEMATLLPKIKVKDIMTKDPVTIEADMTLDDAAIIMHKRKISSLPVMEKKRLAGIITESDVFKALVLLTGAYRGGVKFGFELPDKPGSIKEAADVVRAFGGKLVSILTSYEDAREGFRKVYIRATGIGRKELKALHEELNRKFHVLYVREAEKD